MTCYSIISKKYVVKNTNRCGLLFCKYGSSIWNVNPLISSKLKKSQTLKGFDYSYQQNCSVKNWYLLAWMKKINVIIWYAVGCTFFPNASLSEGILLPLFFFFCLLPISGHALGIWICGLNLYFQFFCIDFLDKLWKMCLDSNSEIWSVKICVCKRWCPRGLWVRAPAVQ